ncbi:hypothetical protein GCM10007920_40370 [Ciceribacter naphthalenivorans]|uniref:Uncharacterized protein n=2 Tax=Alphaproteobacteria TaxID=28211 RepID=A0A512HDS5_9HYPH|nr:hypothetical protein RNA01_05370 [Ciceribacter naphthalenivorans]GLR24243.1 hypothetical protein GCM10007920_40370 [Ciceribacter naphthalenivorans]GLT07099.1 hypothetical protein GCM10007926_40370 [Sphingomonas psychrolutea]
MRVERVVEIEHPVADMGEIVFVRAKSFVGHNGVMTTMTDFRKGGTGRNQLPTYRLTCPTREAPRSSGRERE